MRLLSSDTSEDVREDLTSLPLLGAGRSLLCAAAGAPPVAAASAGGAAPAAGAGAPRGIPCGRLKSAVDTS